MATSFSVYIHAVLNSFLLYWKVGHLDDLPVVVSLTLHEFDLTEHLCVFM